MKLTPFAVIYGGTLASNVLLSSLAHIHAGTVAQLNAQIAEINANFALYGYGSSPGLPLLPAIPTPGTSAPNGIAYFQSAAPGVVGPTYGPSTSFLLIDAFTANGWSDPSSSLDTLTLDATVVALISAAQSLRAVITTQPNAAVTIDHTAAGNLGTVVASGTNVVFQWQRSALGVGAWTNLTNTGIFTGATTATLTITNPTVLANNQDKYRVLVSTDGAGQVPSRVSTLTVT